MGFKVIYSLESEYFAVANQLITEKQFNAITEQEQGGALLDDGSKAFLGIPLVRIETDKGARFGIVLHNTERSPTLDVYHELNQAFDFFNKRLFDGELPKCLITMQRDKRSRGYFAEGRFVNSEGEQLDEIALNPAFFGVRSIPETLSTLVHEQCHLWQSAFGTPSRSGYHNHEWSDKMLSVGLVPSTTGTKEGKKVGQKMTHYIEEGGLFEQACLELVSTQFSLSWFDRFPPMTEADFIQRVSNAINNIPERLRKPEGNTGADPKVLSFIEDPLPEDEDGNPIKPKKLNSSNRSKYSCPTCNHNMWGAPNSMILCAVEGCEKVAYVEAN
ncbi:sprT domain-containing protein [Acinetobacter chengduensis]|uniref:SprT domain-containing protein n=2 Tax=Acinetobacter chengduensis TaxID=2420890 RepID=A0ABX9TSP2_9GAMM|nr:sprT domain-containing protein [Acinetobacter chengduensis]